MLTKRCGQLLMLTGTVSIIVIIISYQHLHPLTSVNIYHSKEGSWSQNSTVSMYRNKMEKVRGHNSDITTSLTNQNGMIKFTGKHTERCTLLHLRVSLYYLCSLMNLF